MIEQAQKVLKQIFGYDSFRSLQREVISNVLQRKDSLVIMPTGGGKSICYQIPALLFEGLTIVISPLISLMEDQISQLNALGVPATLLNSTLSPDEYLYNISRIQSGEVKLLYVAPETLLQERTISLLQGQLISCITIDEAHCISEWGHEFRPEYRQIIDIRRYFPDAVTVALTATATPQVQKDIINTLGFNQSNEFVAGFDRPNLFLQIIEKNNPIVQAIDYISKFKGQSGIIYCLSRKQVDSLSSILRDEGYSVLPYHAGLSDQKRKENQTLFIRDDVQIIVATIAFGMGINKPNIRFVLHYDLPKNLESYYQQIGRAGRDGLPAHCQMLFGYGDIQKIRYFIDAMEVEQEARLARFHLNTLVQYAESEECRRIPLLHYFGEKISQENCAKCDNCSSPKKKLNDVTTAVQKFLSCTKRSGEMFGAAHIADILRGSEAQKIFNNRHQQLSTYGIGKELSKKQWIALSRKLVQKDILIQDLEYGSLRLTHKARPILLGEEKFYTLLQEDKSQNSSVSKNDEPKDYDTTLFSILKELRKRLANMENVPPYVIFPDKTLIDMAHYFPHSKESMLTLHGIGETKAEKYGRQFLLEIEEYCMQNGITEKKKLSKKSQPQSIPKEKKLLKHHFIGKRYNNGATIEELVQQEKIKLSTILSHLYKCILDGQELRYSGEFLTLSTVPSIPFEKQGEVLRTFKELGYDRLTPVFEKLNGEVSYDDLHALRIYYLVMERK